MVAMPLRISDNRYGVPELARFAFDALAAVGSTDDVARLTAEGLVSASARGVDSHGIRLLPHYIRGARGGRINPDPSFHFERTAPGTGTLDADHTFGHAAGMLGMRHAMTLAGEAGCGHVAVRNSSHCGAMAYFALEACKADMIGLAFTHATARVRTPNATRPYFGNNPVCLAAPMSDEAPFCFDAATTAMSFNEVRQHQETGAPLPPGVAADAAGVETSDPGATTQLLPIGDYKGFGLSMLVDVLCGLLTGMPAGPDVSRMFEDPFSRRRLLGHYFVAIRIDAFEDSLVFRRRLQEMADRVRSEPRRVAESPVLVPGDPEKAVERERLRDGVPLSADDVAGLQGLADELGLEVPSPVPEALAGAPKQSAT